MAPLPKIEVRNEPGKPFQKLEPANDNVHEEIDAETLLGMDFPPIQYVIPGYVPEGLTILAGRPKLGKSWMALGFAIAVATGGSALGEECEAGDALYLALEDNPRRLQDRLATVLPPNRSRPHMGRLTLRTKNAKIGAGLIESLDGWRAKSENPRLIIIDTLSMVRPPKKANQDSYAADYDAISPLQQYAGEHRLALIVVHHVRKAEAEDPLEAVSGTNGLTGAADTIMVLNRDQGGSKLYGRGRDIEELEKAVKLDRGVWAVLGDADDVKRSDQQRKILAALTEATGILTPAEIAKETDIPGTSVRHMLGRLVKDGKAEKNAFGQYKLAGR